MSDKKTTIPEEESWVCYSEIKETFEIDDVFGKFGFKTKDGVIKIDPQFASCREFHQGLCAVALGPTWYYTPEGNHYYEMHWGFINKFGKVVIPLQFSEVSDFNNFGIAVADGKLINKNGQILTEDLEYDFDSYMQFDERYVEFISRDNFNGFPTGKPNDTGLYDTKEMRVVYPPIADAYSVYDDNLILVMKAEKSPYEFSEYYINNKGESLFPWLENKGYWSVEKPDTLGNAIVSRTEYVEAPNATAFFSIDNKKYIRIFRYGVAGKEGELIPCEYEKIKRVAALKYECSIGDEIFEINLEKQLTIKW